MKNIITLLALLVTSHALAEISSEQAVTDCLKIKYFSVTGDKYYKQNQYSKAREQYEQQAAWSESCQLSEPEIATAYNNIAMTYIHENKYLKAKAWLEINPSDNKSIFNLNKFKKQINTAIKNKSGTPEGEYWQYAGKSLWNVFTINKKNEKYEFNFEGYYAGLMAMYYGPNMGSFSATLHINDSKAHYNMAETNDADFDCAYNFSITDTMLIVEHESGTSCGFGHNVSAEGAYQKVEF
jgi:tetratricopeptide (TPR) repeat protein